MDREALRGTLHRLLEEETWDCPPALDDTLLIREGLKLDSVDLLAVALRVERELNVSFTAADFGDIETVGDLLNAMERKLGERRQAA